MKFSHLAMLAFVSVAVGQVTYHSGLNVNKCLDLVFNSQSSGNTIDIFDCNGSGAQQWVANLNGPAIHLLENQNFCLDGGSNPQVGSPVAISPCNSNFASQRFTPTLNGDFIELSTTGLCIGVPNGDTTNENGLLLADCNPNDNAQVWHAAELRFD